MDVRYDARSEAATQAATQVPGLSEYLEMYPKLSDALQACSLRFVVNLPEESLRNAPRLCFELQEAFWFYLDYLWEGSKRELPKLNQLNFVTLMLESSDVLKSLYFSSKARQQLIQEWREYVRRVPLKGAVMLNERLDQCLMVQPWKGDKWTYPRGKINENESECECAIREVWEETGIDIKGRVDPGRYVKADVHGTSSPVKLFLVQGVPEESACAPRTRKEISKIGWIQLEKLPGWDPGGEDTKLRFIGVEPFVPELRSWVEGQRALAAAAEPGRQGPKLSSARPASEGPAPEPKQSQRNRRRGSAAKDNGAAPPKDAGASAANDNDASCEAPFTLDLAKVMREFDQGWRRAAERGGKRPSP